MTQLARQTQTVPSSIFSPTEKAVCLHRVSTPNGCMLSECATGIMGWHKVDGYDGFGVTYGHRATVSGSGVVERSG